LPGFDPSNGGAGASAPPVGESFFQNLEATRNWAAQFANRLSVTCP
jgi:hypothetical protein